jgi:hypothetical protein
MSVITRAEQIISQFNLNVTENTGDKLSAYGDVANCLLRITILYNRYSKMKPCVVFTHIDTGEQIIKVAA